MTATITSLPNMSWNALAALNYAQENITIDTKLVVVWFNKEDEISYSNANLDNKDMLWIAEVLKLQALGVTE